MVDEQKKEEFAQLFMQLSPADHKLTLEYVDALKAGDTEKMEQLWQEARSRGKDDGQ